MTAPEESSNRKPTLFRLGCLDQMEAEMYKSFVAVAAAVAILSGSLLISGRAEAGASASAPSRYSHKNQVVAATQTKGHYAITEYSSSSARNPQKH